MLEDLKKQVCDANVELVQMGLVILTFGNVSGVDRASGNVVIKPSGVPYDHLRPQDMVVVDLESGRTVDGGQFKPSRDTPTHLELYRAFKNIGAVAHTRSLFATAWAQARWDIQPLGSTHAEYFYGPVPVTRLLTPAEILHDYELHIGKAIVERFAKLELDPALIPAILVADHGPFVWGPEPSEAVHNAAVLEQLAKLAIETLRVDPNAKPIQRELLDKHFFRTHRPDKKQ